MKSPIGDKQSRSGLLLLSLIVLACFAFTACEGPAGAPGTAGDKGRKGDPGDPGKVGGSGSAGPAGPAGSAGPAGPAGPGGGGGLATIPPAFTKLNLVALHNPMSPGFLANEDGACITCHGERLEPTAKASVPNFHELHFTKVAPYKSLKGNERCISCHVKDVSGNPVAIDVIKPLGAGSGARIRKQVDVGHCATCHCPGGVGKKLYANCL